MDKPVAKVIGKNGNVFNVLGICALALKRAGQNDKVAEMQNRVFDLQKEKSYNDALAIMSEYVDLR